MAQQIRALRSRQRAIDRDRETLLWEFKLTTRRHYALIDALDREWNRLERAVERMRDKRSA